MSDTLPDMLPVAESRPPWDTAPMPAIDEITTKPAPGQHRVPTVRTIRGEPRNITHQGVYQFWLPWTLIRRVPWLLLPILAFQAITALRMIWNSTVFQDEGLYLWAGRAEWAHWLHGTSIPAFPTYFSGAPILYPPLGALADSIGGLAAARILSLLFMLGATTLVYATASRLLSRYAAPCAAAVFAALGPTLHLSSFATYDAMALFLLALATWCVAGSQEDPAPAKWLLIGAVALAMANATKYATTLFDPVVIAVAMLASFPQPTWKPALRRGALFTGTTAAIIIMLIRIGGPWYADGITVTTTERVAGAQTAADVLISAWHWIAPVIVLPIIAIIIVIVTKQRITLVLLLCTLGGAALLAPAEQARINTTVSLNKHADFGAWFAAIAAGYVVAAITSLVRARLRQAVAILVLTCALVIPTALNGVTQASQMISWPQSTKLISILRPLTAHGGRFLAEDSSVEEYNLPNTTWQQWSSTFAITMPDDAVVDQYQEGTNYTKAINDRYFKVIILWFGDTKALDQRIAAAISASHRYKLAASVPFSAGSGGHGVYLVWTATGPSTAKEGSL